MIYIIFVVRNKVISVVIPIVIVAVKFEMVMVQGLIDNVFCNDNSSNPCRGSIYWSYLHSINDISGAMNSNN